MILIILDMVIEHAHHVIGDSREAIEMKCVQIVGLNLQGENINENYML